jgi:dynein heavy chain
VNGTWESIMSAVNENNQALEFCMTTTKLLEQLRGNNESLDIILKSLNDYLNSKRDIFPRFYFLANEELLAILSNSQDMKNV